MQRRRFLTTVAAVAAAWPFLDWSCVLQAQRDEPPPEPHTILLLIDGATARQPAAVRLVAQQVVARLSGRDPVEDDPTRFTRYVLAGVTPETPVQILVAYDRTAATPDVLKLLASLPGAATRQIQYPGGLPLAEMRRRLRVLARSTGARRVWELDSRTKTSGNLRRKFRRVGR